MFFRRKISQFAFSSLKDQKKLFLLTYKYVEDIYYKRSLSFPHNIQ